MLKNNKILIKIMEEEDLIADVEDESPEAEELEQIWESLSPWQKKYFKKLVEKNEENMNYIG